MSQGNDIAGRGGTFRVEDKVDGSWEVAGEKTVEGSGHSLGEMASFLFCFVFGRVSSSLVSNSLCSSGLSRTSNPLPSPPTGWDYRYA